MPRSTPTPPRRRSLLLLRLGLSLPLLVAACGKNPKTDAPTVTPAGAQQAHAATADDLDARLERLTERLEEARVNHHIPGMAVAVVKDDEIIFAEGFGLADLETKRKATPDTVFAIGSTTKAFTSTLVAMMIDEGKMSWDDPVVRHVPEFTLAPRPKEAKAAPPQPTLRDMLCHRSGFTRMSLLWAGGALPPKEMFAKASGAEPIADYREKFLYNNVTYASAGEASARVAGTSWGALLQSRILDPLGMKQTNVTTAAAKADPLRATGYRWRQVQEVHEAVPMRSLDAIAPAGAINSTVLDMAQWLRLQLGRGEYEGERLVSSDRIADTWSSQIEVGGGIRYGMGWMLGDWQGHRVVEHGGNIDGYAAEVAMLPDDGLGYVLLTNISVSPLQRESMNIVFDSLLGEVKGDQEGPALDLTPYVGKYIANFGPFSDARFTVTTAGGKLFVDVPGQTNYELRPPNEEGRWAFALTDAIQVAFDRDDAGKAQVLHMRQGGFDFELPRVGYSFPPDFTPEQVAGKPGTYRDADGKVEVTVRLEEGRLMAAIKGQMDFALRKPDDKGRWALRANDGIAISFRETKGTFDAITIHEGAKDRLLTRIESKEVPLPTVAALLKKSKADAFAKRVAKLGAVELRGKVRVPSSNLEGTFRVVFDDERRRRVELDFGAHGRSIDTYDGTSAWTISTMGPPTEHKGKFLRQAGLGTAMLLGDWSAGFDQASVEARQGKGADERIVVMLRADGLPPAKIFVDPKTGDVRAIEMSQLDESSGMIPMKIEQSDFRRAKGLRLPYRFRSYNVHSGSTIFETESVKKVAADPALFSRATL